MEFQDPFGPHLATPVESNPLAQAVYRPVFSGNVDERGLCMVGCSVLEHRAERSSDVRRHHAAAGGDRQLAVHHDQSRVVPLTPADVESRDRVVLRRTSRQRRRTYIC